MRKTYTDIYNQFLRNIGVGSAGTTNTDITNEFNASLGSCYQLVLAALKNYKTYTTYNFSVGMVTNDITNSKSANISTITSSGTTATVTTTTAHGYTTNDVVSISGVNPTGYNGTFTITVTSTTQFTYTLNNSVNNVNGTSIQYYPYPPGYVNSDGIVITVGSVNFPLKIIHSEYLWEQLNAILIQASALPQFYYPRRDDFGIWPIPQAVYNGSMYYHYRDRNLSVADYTAGTISVSNGSYNVTGSGTTFTKAMQGRWFTISDPTVYGQGYWYRIAQYISATSISLFQPYQGSTASGISSYRIGETPEIPEEGHMIFADGTTGLYFLNMRGDIQKGQAFLNSFYNGDPTNPNREMGNKKVSGGLIGLINRWNDRDDQRVIDRDPHLNPLQTKVFAQSLS